MGRAPDRNVGAALAAVVLAITGVPATAASSIGNPKPSVKAGCT